MITTNRSDIIWNYIGTIVSFASGFVLLPFLMRYLTSEELGLWYVYVSISNLAMLFEFGFNPTFARNIVYVISGARTLSVGGGHLSTNKGEINWRLLNLLIRTSKFIYAIIALLVLVGLTTIGTTYIHHISHDIANPSFWNSWIIFCIAIVFNLYFLYSTSILRGYGDIAGENQAKTFARIAQLIASAILLMGGFGLIGASIGYLVNTCLFRILVMLRLRSHQEIEQRRREERAPVHFVEMYRLLKTIGHFAWRDGLVQLANYGSTQAMSIMCSLYLGLKETGTYSVYLQLGTAAYNFATVYPKSFFPAVQSSFVEGDKDRLRTMIASGVIAYWGLYIIAVAGLVLVILPILPLFKSDIMIDYPLFIILSLYLALWNQHSLFCNYIISMNEIPYLKGYIFAVLLGILGVYLLAGVANMGTWGIVIGQALSQAVYNNWKWPSYLCTKIDISYISLLDKGISIWKRRIFR